MPTPTQPVTLITGSGSGIGRALALQLADAGHAIAISGRTTSKLNETAQLISAKHGYEHPVLIHPADLTQARNCHLLIQSVGDRFGRLDALANVAGYATWANISDITPEHLQLTIDTNLNAPIHLTRAAWNLLKTNGGTVVNVSSQASIDPFPALGAYAAAKAGLNMFTLVTAREGAEHNIKAVTIAPGAVETQMLRGLLTEDQLPASDCLTPGEVAQLITDCILGNRPFESGEVIPIVK